MCIYLFIYVLNTCDGKQTFLIQETVLLQGIFLRDHPQKKIYSHNYNIKPHCVCADVLIKSLLAFLLYKTLFFGTCTYMACPRTYSWKITSEYCCIKKQGEVFRFANKSYEPFRSNSYFENKEQKMFRLFILHEF